MRVQHTSQSETGLFEGVTGGCVLKTFDFPGVKWSCAKVDIWAKIKNLKDLKIHFLPKDTCRHSLRAICTVSEYCWILEFLYCTPKGRRALLRIPTTGRAKCLPMLGSLKT